jgi:hypothetical protein
VSSLYIDGWLCLTDFSGYRAVGIAGDTSQ